MATAECRSYPLRCTRRRDDCLDELPLFQPSPKTGLTAEIAKGIEDFLAGRSDKDMRANAITRLGQNIHALFGRDKS